MQTAPICVRQLIAPGNTCRAERRVRARVGGGDSIALRDQRLRRRPARELLGVRDLLLEARRPSVRHRHTFRGMSTLNALNSRRRGRLKACQRGSPTRPNDLFCTAPLA